MDEISRLAGSTSAGTDVTRLPFIVKFPDFSRTVLKPKLSTSEILSFVDSTTGIHVVPLPVIPAPLYSFQ